MGHLTKAEVFATLELVSASNKNTEVHRGKSSTTDLNEMESPER